MLCPLGTFLSSRYVFDLLVMCLELWILCCDVVVVCPRDLCCNLSRLVPRDMTLWLFTSFCVPKSIFSVLQME